MNAFEFSPLPALPRRDPAGHKGSFGSVLVVGGCAHEPRTMLGGAVLAARAALRAGAGRAILAVPEPLAREALLLLPEATVVALPCDPRGHLLPSPAAERIDAALAEARVAVIGPALGRSDEAGQVVMRLLSLEDALVVVDADAIRAFADHRDPTLDLRAAAVFTPHPGEAAALADALALEIDCTERATRPSAAHQLAQRLGAVVVLKGAGTVTSGGLEAWRCERGGPALATGGSGDVLAGVVGGLLAQFAPRPDPIARALGRAAKEPSLAATAATEPSLAATAATEPSIAALAALAVEAHARAGDLWTADHGNAGALAHEIADRIPDALVEMRST